MSKQPAKNLLDFDIEPVAPPNISQQRQPTITKLPQQQFNPAANSAPAPAQQRFTQTSYPQQANYAPSHPQQANYAPAHPQQPQAHPPAPAYQAQFYQQQQHLQQQQSPQVYQQQHFPQQVQQQHLQNVQQHQQPFYGAPQQFQPIGQQSQKPKSLNPFDEDFELPQPVLQKQQAQQPSSVLQKQLPVQPQQPSMQQARTVQPVVQQQLSVQQQQSSVQPSQQARTVQQPVVQPAVLSAFTPNPANQQAFVPRQGPLVQANSHANNGSTLPQQVTPSVQKPPQQVSAVGVGQPQQKPAVVAPAQRPLPSANPVQQRPVKSVNEFETKETRVQEAEAPAWEDTWKKNSVDKDTLQSKDSDFKNLKASNFAPFAQNTNWRKK